MKKFYTITDANTEHTNSRSTKFPSYEAAIESATSRINGFRSDEVYILEAVAVVRKVAIPVEVVTL